MKKRVRHHFVGNADKQIKALDQGKLVPQYFERCDRCGKIVRAVQTPKERRRYCPANPKVLPLAGLGASREQPVVGSLNK